MSFSPLVFTGVSQYSTDFQSIVDRAAAIARLPATALENQQKDLVQQKLLVSNLSTAAGALGDAVAALGALGHNKALAASSSDETKVSATNVNSPAPALYSITNISSIARPAAESSLSGYGDGTTSAVASTGTVKLIVGSNEYSIDLSGSNNLQTLRDRINNLHAGVTASVLTTGTGANPYYLSVTADTAGARTLELRDDPSGANTNLLSANNQGANTEFDINGVHVSKTTTLVNDVVPGVTFQVLDTTGVGESVDVQLDSNRSSLASAIQSFVAAYNTVREQVNQQVGESAGLLTGDFLVREVHSQLQKLTNFNGEAGSSVRSLTDLGIVFDTAGVASFDSTAFNALSDSQLQDAFSFLGSTSEGFGGLSRNLQQISDPVIGLAKIQLDQYDKSNARITAQIATINARVTDLQKSVAARLQVMDTLLSTLTSQQTLLDASIQSLNYSTYGKQNN